MGAVDTAAMAISEPAEFARMLATDWQLRLSEYRKLIADL